MNIWSILLILNVLIRETESGWLQEKWRKVKTKVVDISKGVADKGNDVITQISDKGKEVTNQVVDKTKEWAHDFAGSDSGEHDLDSSVVIEAPIVMQTPPPTPSTTTTTTSTTPPPPRTTTRPTTTTTPTRTTTSTTTSTTTTSTTISPTTTTSTTVSPPTTRTTSTDRRLTTTIPKISKTLSTSYMPITTAPSSSASELESNKTESSPFWSRLFNSSDDPSGSTETERISWRPKTGHDSRWILSTAMPLIKIDITDSSESNSSSYLVMETNTTYMSTDTTAKTLNYSKWIVLFIIITIIFCCLSATFILIFSCAKRKKKISTREDVELLPNYLHEQLETLEYNNSYEVERNRIAAGYFGEVYDGTLLTEQWNTSRLDVFSRKKISVAVKTYGNATRPEDVALRKKLLEDELKLMSNVGSHPNVVTLIGAVTNKNSSEGTLIIMDKCSNGNLAHFLKSKKIAFTPQFELKNQEQFKYYRIVNETTRATIIQPPKYKHLARKVNWKPDLSKNITTAHLLSFSMQIAQGMEYLSSINCVHRDLAARNILLTGKGTVKVADFGLAKRIRYSEYYSECFRSQNQHELPCRWMSLESLKGGKFSTESDIWSYGILLYEIFTLCDSLPYPTVSDDGAILDEIEKGTRNDQPEYCPDPIYNHMTLCWDLDSEKRPTFRCSAELMKNHLSQASVEVLQAVSKECRRESERQNQLAALRRGSKSNINRKNRSCDLLV